MIDPILRARVLAHVTANPACKGLEIGEACTSGRFRRSDVRAALTAMSRDGTLVAVGPNGHQRYTVGKPVVADDAAAIAHLRGFGDLGAEILRLAAIHKITPSVLLSGRSPAVGKKRGLIISHLVGPRRLIAEAMKTSTMTVRVYQPERNAA